ncbi:hypothetical protein, partial [Faecalicatena contorta]|uniref:hypothetical protein n=1 Tax=Faecalicatena contorta TaxID=39482 RepID=UPI001F24F55D
FSRHSILYVQCLCPFLANFFSCTIFSCQFSLGISFIEIPRSYVCNYYTEFYYKYPAFSILNSEPSGMELDIDSDGRKDYHEFK